MQRVAIVGAGIAGLTLANLLERIGCAVEVYEAAATLQPVGAGFTLQPNGLETIKHLGLETVIQRDVCCITRSTILDPSGQSLGVDIMKGLSGAEESYAIHRADMHRHLESSLGRGVVIHLGSKVVAVEPHRRGAWVKIATGERSDFDLVVGADGVHSVVRSSGFPYADLRLKQGIAVRTVIALREDDSVPKVFRSWIGAGMLLLTYPIRGGRELNIVSYQPWEEELGSSWSGSYPIEALKERYGEWDPQIMKLLDKVKSCFYWQLVDMDPLPSFVDKRTCLVGDAAHPMLPYLGQGANQAFVDCRILAESLDPWLKNESSLEEALLGYDSKRNLAISRIVDKSAEAGRIFKSDFGDVRRKKREVEVVLGSRKEGNGAE